MLMVVCRPPLRVIHSSGAHLALVLLSRALPLLSLLLLSLLLLLSAHLALEKTDGCSKIFLKWLKMHVVLNNNVWCHPVVNYFSCVVSTLVGVSLPAIIEPALKAIALIISFILSKSKVSI